MKIHHDLITVLMFWSLYVPMSLVLWYESGHKDNWAVILAIGLVIVLLYLVISLIVSKLKRRSMENDDKEYEPKKIETIKQDFILPPSHFENVFKENFGVVTRDVD